MSRKKKKTVRRKVKKVAKRKAAKSARKAPKKKTFAVIVKRKAHREQYDERKVYASVYFGCRNAHLTEIQSEKIAEKVSSSIKKIVSKERIILSDKLFQLITKEMKKYNKDAAFLYETHRDIC